MNREVEGREDTWPYGWYPLGLHIHWEPIPDLEMTEPDETGLPKWERPRTRGHDGIRTAPYVCEDEGHIMGQWMPRNKTTYYSQCVIPKCKHVRNKEARG
jgi:hypothetical protein